MSNLQFSPLEKELATADLAKFQTSVDSAKATLANAKTALDVKSQICKIWGEIGKYVKLAEPLPIVGKYITLLANLLDGLCTS